MTLPRLPLDGLPPMMALALAELRKALDEPAGPPTWPVVNTPAIQAMIDREQAKPGRPSDIKPHQVVRLVRFVKLGDRLTVAAKKAGMTHQAASKVLSGQVLIAHHPAVTAAGVFLPARKPRLNSPKPPSRAERHPEGSTSAPRPENRAESALPGFES